MTFDVRSFLVPHAAGLVLIDAGLPGNGDFISVGLERMGARWTDITDIVLTHKHFDHVGALDEVSSRASSAAVWAGAEDAADIAFHGTITALDEGDHVRDLRVLATPGHTPGHRCLIHDGEAVLFAGDAAGSADGVFTRGPSEFTEDAATAERSLRRLASMEWERMVFAHGPEVPDARGDLMRLLEDTDRA